MDAPKHAKIEIWPVEKLVPYEKNAKKHSPEQVEGIAKLIRAHGWTQPIVVQRATGSIIAGHGRRLAAISLGLKAVPVLAVDLSDEETRKARLADNRIASTDYDTSMLQDELASLKDLGLSIDDMGFNAKELDFLSEQITDFNEDAFIDDIQIAVEEQKADNAKQQAEMDEEDAPLARSFGFKRLSISQGRRVRAFMNHVEVETDMKGAAALIAYIDTLGLK